MCDIVNQWGVTNKFDVDKLSVLCSVMCNVGFQHRK